MLLHRIQHKEKKLLSNKHWGLHCVLTIVVLLDYASYWDACELCYLLLFHLNLLELLLYLVLST